MTRVFLLAATLLLLACSDPGSGPNPHARDQLLRLNNVQARGTHNSYHQEPVAPLDDSHRYSHASLTIQLSRQGVRQLELDLHYRDGVGFEVFHLPLLDPETSCRRFKDCLGQVRAWSDANPWHMPLLIWLEPKDEADALDKTLLPIKGRYTELEAEILSVFTPSRLFTPDDLRGAHKDLPAAVAATGWPTLGRLRGRVIFALLDSGQHRAGYTAGAASLQGRLMFVDADKATDSFAAMFKINDAAAASAQVAALVKAGFIVTSNVDEPGSTDAENQKKLDASLAAGAHFLSSDFPAPVKGRAYAFSTMPGGTIARCNPVFLAATCEAEDIENL